METKEGILHLDMIEEYREGKQLEAKAAQGGMPEIHEEVGVDRVVLSLPHGGNEQDVKAMLELYDNPEELTFPEEEMSYNVEVNDKGVDKVAIKQMIVDKMAIMRGKDTDKLATNAKTGDK